MTAIEQMLRQNIIMVSSSGPAHVSHINKRHSCLYALARPCLAKFAELDTNSRRSS